MPYHRTVHDLAQSATVKLDTSTPGCVILGQADMTIVSIIGFVPTYDTNDIMLPSCKLYRVAECSTAGSGRSSGHAACAATGATRFCGRLACRP